MYNTPILFLIFNRPETTERVFEKIREIKPKQLFIAADGPREGNTYDEINCKSARKITTNVDWDCEVFTLLREENLGCGIAVSQAITWFFAHVEEGLIIEDDCLPNSSFFQFCEEALKKYRYNQNIFHICGSNYQYGKWRGDGDYYFSRLTHIWGWATWKRAWEKYEFRIEGEDFLLLQAYPSEKYELIHQEWKKIFNDFRAKCVDTWDFQWLLTCWKHDGITIIPNKNLILNLGFGDNATHTTVYPFHYKKIKHENFLEKIKHPKEILICYEADLFEQKIRMRSGNKIRSLLHHLKEVSKSFFTRS